jgi:hypothetical protein
MTKTMEKKTKKKKSEGGESTKIKKTKKTKKSDPEKENISVVSAWRFPHCLKIRVFLKLLMACNTWVD